VDDLDDFSMLHIAAPAGQSAVFLSGAGNSAATGVQAHSAMYLGAGIGFSDTWFISHKTSGNLEIGKGLGSSTKLTIFDSGNLKITGTGTANSWQTPSDFRFKKNIKPLLQGLEKINQIKGVQYRYKNDHFSGYDFPDKDQIGFIAQDIGKILPEVVSQDKEGYQSVDYSKVVPVLVEAIKELNRKVEKLESQLKSMK